MPLAGNMFRTAEAEEGGRRTRRRSEGVVLSPGETQTAYFRVEQACKLELQISLKAKSTSKVVVSSEGVGLKTALSVDPTSSVPSSIGEIEVEQSQYVAIDFELEKYSKEPVELVELIVNTADAETKLDFVRDNKGNMFYWGRRGPSVHLNYRTPRDTQLRYAYSEVTVAEGDDPIGSFFMANGFGEGYFGFQVNSPSERRVLFSVWSPFSTNNPREIPADQRIQLLAKGERVRVGQFGNEGSGGQSFLLYPWQAGKTYRFLTKVKPDGKGNTIYTSWFGDKAKGEWILIASFLRPKTDTNLRRFHSFLENFSPSTGHLGRKGSYGNIWCRSVDGKWFACQQARFTTDATGRGRHRLDFAGGASGSAFYLRNCGFFSPYTQPDTNLSLETQTLEPPQIDFQSLPMQ